MSNCTPETHLHPSPFRTQKLRVMPLEKRLMLDASLPAIAGQVLWLDAADASTVRDQDGDYADTGLGGAGNGFSGLVSQWRDKSGSTFHVNGFSVGELPTYSLTALNGRNVISFDGINDRLANLSDVIAGNDVTMFIVYNRTSLNATGREAVFELGQNPSRNGIFLNNSGDGRHQYYSNTAFTNFATGYTTGDYIVASATHDITNIRMHRNGALEFNATTSARASTTGIYVGDDSTSGDFLQGNIAEIIVYDRDLTDEERHDIENYLGTKWGQVIVNNAPVQASNTGVTLDELTTTTITSSMLNATDVDNTDSLLRYTLTGVTSNGVLRINGVAASINDSFTQGQIDAGLIAYEHTNTSNFSDSFTFRLSDGYFNSAPTNFSISITPLNDAPVIEGWTQIANEDFQSGATGWTNNLTETSNPFLTRFLGRFSQDGGAQTVSKNFTLSGNQNYTVVEFDFYEIDSWDGETFRIFVNDTMIFNSSISQGIFENPADGSSGIVSWTVQQLTASNTNFAFGTWTDQSYRFTLTINNAAAGNIRLGFGSTLDQGTTDEAWGIDNVKIFEVDDTGIPGPMTIAENSANGTVVGRVTATDPDVGQTISYSIVGGTGASVFAINSATGVITVANSTALNYEATTSFTLQVRATDNGTPILFDTETLTIQVIDIPENTAPTIPATGPFSVSEAAAVNTVLGTVTGTDPDIGQTLTYSIVGGNAAGVFAINATTGAIRIASTVNLNFEITPSYTLQVRATDNGFGNLFFNRNVTVNILNANEAPTFDPVATILNSDPTIRYNATTGNFYRFMNSANVNLATATTNANAALLNGVNGYLANITSAAENAFIQSNLTGTAWIGGSDQAVEGQWRWLNGPEAGQLFWLGNNTGSAQNGFYTNWQTNEPSNSGGVPGEDGIQFRNSDGRWNDIPVTTNQRYVIEWTGAQVLASLQNGPYTVAENTAINTVIGTANSSDVDVGDTRSYSITGGTGAGLFAINPTTGAIRVTGALNYEAATSYTLNLRVTDAGGLFDNTVVTINLTDVNEAPIVTAPGSYDFDENSPIGTHVVTIAALDPDAGQTLTYSILSGNTGGMFSINSTTGEVTFAGSPDFELQNLYSLVIRVTDNGATPLFNDTNLDVIINNVFENPVLNPTGPFNFNENSAVNTPVTTLTATDPDMGDVLTYSIQSGNTGGMFALDAVTGALRFAGSPNFEAVPSYALVVRVTDQTGLFSETTVNITINNLNETPTINAAGPFSFAENTAINTLITTMTGSDPDTGQTLTYSIVAGNSGNMFSINGSNGQLRFAGSPNFELQNSYTLTIRATDNGSGSLFSQTNVTINITNVNEAPSFSDVQAILNANPSVRYNPTNGHFYQFVTAPANFNAAIANAAAMTLNGVNGYLATSTTASENTFIFSIITSNAWLGGSDQAVEGEWRWVTGPEAGQLFWLGAVSGTPQGGLYNNWAGGEPNNSGNEDALEIGRFGVRWNDFNANAAQAYIVEWTGADVLASLQNGPYTINENIAINTLVGTVNSSDPDVGDTRSYSVMGGTGTAFFSVDALTGQIRTIAPLDFEAGASYTLNLRVTDAAGLSDNTVITININDLNETPILNPAGPFQFDENIAVGTNVTTMTANDQDIGQTLTYSIQSGNTGGMFAINAATGQITFAGSPNFEAVSSYNLVVRVTDNGFGNLFSEQTISIGINDLNETPILNPVGPLSIPENVPSGTVITTLIGTDVDAGQTLTYTIQSGNGSGLFALDSATGVLTFTASPNFEAGSLYTLVLRVTDDGVGALYSEQTITINILDVNDAPLTLTLSNNRIVENSTIGTVIGDFTTFDEDVADTHIYSLLINPFGKFALVGNQLVSNDAIDYEQHQSFTIRIRTDDGNGGILDQNFMIIVEDVMDTFTAPPASGFLGQFIREEVVSKIKLQDFYSQLIMNSLDGGASGQMLAYYGVDGLPQIILNNMSQPVQDIYQEAFDLYGFFQHTPMNNGDPASPSEEVNQPADSYTNLRQALEYLQAVEDQQKIQTKDVSDGNQAQLSLPRNAIEQEFVDVLTYHQERQAKLRQALLS
jgi:VCBS repeat-containing protein